MLWLVYALIVIASALLVWLYTGHDNPTTADVLAIIVLALVEAAGGFTLLRARMLRRLRSVLAGLPPSDERVTRGDVLQAMKASADAVSDKQLLVRGAIGAAASVCFIVNVVLQMTIVHGNLLVALFWLAGAITFAWTSASTFGRLRSRVKARS
jgi:hypothetical protein